MDIPDSFIEILEVTCVLHLSPVFCSIFSEQILDRLASLHQPLTRAATTNTIFFMARLCEEDSLTSTYLALSERYQYEIQLVEEGLHDELLEERGIFIFPSFFEENDYSNDLLIEMDLIFNVDFSERTIGKVIERSRFLKREAPPVWEILSRDYEIYFRIIYNCVGESSLTYQCLIDCLEAFPDGVVLRAVKLEGESFRSVLVGKSESKPINLPTLTESAIGRFFNVCVKKRLLKPDGETIVSVDMSSQTFTDSLSEVEIVQKHLEKIEMTRCTWEKIIYDILLSDSPITSTDDRLDRRVLWKSERKMGSKRENPLRMRARSV